MDFRGKNFKGEWTRQDKIDFLRRLAAGTCQINEILPLRTVHFHETSEGSGRFIKLQDGQQFERGMSGALCSLDDISEMEEKAYRTGNSFFVIHRASDTPIATCDEDILL